MVWPGYRTQENDCSDRETFRSPLVKRLLGLLLTVKQLGTRRHGHISLHPKFYARKYHPLIDINGRSDHDRLMLSEKHISCT